MTTEVQLDVGLGPCIFNNNIQIGDLSFNNYIKPSYETSLNLLSSKVHWFAFHKNGKMSNNEWPHWTCAVTKFTDLHFRRKKWLEYKVNDISLTPTNHVQSYVWLLHCGTTGIPWTQLCGCNYLSCCNFGQKVSGSEALNKKTKRSSLYPCLAIEFHWCIA